MLTIYNSLSKQKEPFKPVKPGHVSLYACGMTVYDHSHIGHARAMIVFDAIVRYLRYRDYQVTYVRNITDIDDKIIKRAEENGEPCHALTDRMIEILHEDEQALKLLSPDHEPRATGFIEPIIALIEVLIEKGAAYVVAGDVYFSVRHYKDYGKLSHRDIEQLRSGVRVDINDAKQDPLDFVLWKVAKVGEPSWSSPWGDGRPGWHIECSAMATQLLGQPFDIHGGGLDLKFPHHENEIAQSESAQGCGFASIWMHVGLLQINREKMSKSLGNFFTIREVLGEHHYEVVRYFMLAAHYRSPVNYSVDNLLQARKSLEHWYLAIRGLPLDEPGDPLFEGYREAFFAAMDDDFNTPEALAVLFELAHEINRVKSEDPARALGLARALRDMAAVLGVLQEDAEHFLKGELSETTRAKVNALVAARQQARVSKNWVEADRLRDEVASMNVVIEDDARGTRWRFEK